MAPFAQQHDTWQWLDRGPFLALVSAVAAQAAGMVDEANVVNTVDGAIAGHAVRVGGAAALAATGATA